MLVLLMIYEMPETVLSPVISLCKLVVLPEFLAVANGVLISALLPDGAETGSCTEDFFNKLQPMHTYK